MVADMGTKALPVGQFTLYRDVMNGYALVKAAYPEKELSSLTARVRTDAPKKH